MPIAPVKISELTELTSLANDDKLPIVDDSASTPATKNMWVKLSTLKAWLAFLTNPMTTAGDLIVGGVSGAAARLGIGSDGQILKVVSGAIAWAADTAGMTNPMTTSQDIIVGGASGAPGRLAKGSDGQVLKVVAGSLAWAADETGSGMSNPMTTSQDLIVGGASGAPGRLAKGSDGQVLKVVAGSLAWATDETASSGMSNPMTTAGDLIVGGASGAPGRLAKGSDGQVLKVVSGSLAWAADSTGAAGGAPTSAAAITASTDLDSATSAGGFIGVDPTSGAVSITIRPNSAYSYSDNFSFRILAENNSNATSLVRGSGVALTLNNNDANITLTAGTVYHVWRRGVDDWLVIGQG